MYVYTSVLYERAEERAMLIMCLHEYVNSIVCLCLSKRYEMRSL